jgi:membrane fusion protein, multidrug efflux system
MSADQPAPAPPNDQKAVPAPSPNANGTPLLRRLAFPLVVIAIAALVAGWYFLHSLGSESTDDAFIEGRITQVSPKVSGQIVRLQVDDNRMVQDGQVIARIDPRDYEAAVAREKGALEVAAATAKAERATADVTSTTAYARLEQAKASVEAARAQLDSARKRIEQADAQIESARANLEQEREAVSAADAEATRTDADLARYRQLKSEGTVSQQTLDAATAAAASSNAALRGARQRVTGSRALLDVATALRNGAVSSELEAQAQLVDAQARLVEAMSAPVQVAVAQARATSAEADVEQTRAKLREAELQLDYATITAPSAGRVTHRAVEQGTFVQPGQALMAIVPDEFWVVANFKETQLTRMKPGQPADIRIDAYPGRVFRGHVDSMQAGSGARFSLLPAENATGNYVKVVQRVPVKIVFDEHPGAEYHLGPGMSVVPRVRIK